MKKVVEIGKEKVSVSVDFDGYISNEDINERGMAYVKILYGKKDAALDLVAEKFLDTYNDAWSDPEEGYPIMNAEAFTDCFKFDGIIISDVEKSGSLWFIDNGVMGEHFFEVDFDENDKPDYVSMMG